MTIINYTVAVEIQIPWLRTTGGERTFKQNLKLTHRIAYEYLAFQGGVFGGADWNNKFRLIDINKKKNYLFISLENVILGSLNMNFLESEWKNKH